MKRWCYSLLHRPVTCRPSPYWVYCIQNRQIVILQRIGIVRPYGPLVTMAKNKFTEVYPMTGGQFGRELSETTVFSGNNDAVDLRFLHNIITSKKTMRHHHQQHFSSAPQDEHPQSVRSFRSGTPYPTFRPRDPSILGMLGQTAIGSRVQIPQPQQKQLSVRSFNTTKTTSRVSYRPVLEKQLYEDFPIVAPEEEGANYQAIERILKSENQNLKCQNQLLLREVHKLKKHNYQYREEYHQVKVQLEQARDQCEAQKRRADQMKDMIMNRLAMLEGKFNSEGSSHFAIEECESILEALTFSQSEIK